MYSPLCTMQFKNYIILALLQKRPEQIAFTEQYRYFHLKEEFCPGRIFMAAFHDWSDILSWRCFSSLQQSKSTEQVIKDVTQGENFKDKLKSKCTHHCAHAVQEPLWYKSAWNRLHSPDSTITFMAIAHTFASKEADLQNKSLCNFNRF